MIFYGASGHAKVVLEAHTASGSRVTAIFDDNPDVKELLKFRVQGPYKAEAFINVPLIISVGSNNVRKKIASTISHAFGKVIHPSSCISPTASVGTGTVILAGAVINAEAKIGQHCIINTSALVEHDCIVGDFAHISPGAKICGGVSIGEGTHIGAGTTVIQGISIGKWTTIGAGSVIIENVPDHAVVVGVPGKVIKQKQPGE